MDQRGRRGKRQPLHSRPAADRRSHVRTIVALLTLTVYGRRRVVALRRSTAADRQVRPASLRLQPTVENTRRTPPKEA